MRWKNARRSENVEDRRGGGGRKMAVGGGLGGIVMALIAIFLFKSDPQQVFNQLGAAAGGSGQQQALDPAQEKVADFIAKVLQTTEVVWDEVYPYMARGYRGAPTSYRHPKLQYFTDQVKSACGFASAAMGPFYCPPDQRIYIDLSFYDELATKFRAGGDFAQAYVVAHEVGHHVQNLLGISDRVHEERQRLSKAEYNRLSVRLELQADYLAGVWANRGQKIFQFLESGDLEEGLRAASAVGDDTIQRRSRGHVVPDSFTHGTSEQRIRWFRRGFESGDPLAHDPFRVPYEEL